jgi:hypothetical protein
LDEDVLERFRKMDRDESVPFRVKLKDLLRDRLAKSSGRRRLIVPPETFSMAVSRLPSPRRESDLDTLEEQEAQRPG